MEATPFQHLWLLLERNHPVAVHAHLIRLMGSAKAAVFASQLVYWTRRDPGASSSGWLHKTSDEWFCELGLGRREQESARRALTRLGVLEEALAGQPARRYCRLRLAQLGRLLAERLARPAAELDLHAFCANEFLVRELLGRALPYHRVLAWLTGNVNAALLLTRVIYQHRRHLHVQGWFLLSRLEVERDLGLTRSEQETARKCLRRQRFIEERVACVPPRLYARAVPLAILQALRRLDGRLPAHDGASVQSGDSAKQIGGIPAVQQAEKRQTNCRESRQFVCTKSANQFGGNQQISLAEISISNNKDLTIELLTTTTTAPARTKHPASASEGVVVAVGNHPALPKADCLTVRHGGPEPVQPPNPQPCQPSLVFPHDFLPAERGIAAAELAGLAIERAQLVLDELEGRARRGRRVDCRVGLVRSLARAEREGRFTPGYAWEVQAAREREAQRQAERRTREAREREEAQVLQTQFEVRTEGKTGYEAFRELTGHLRRRTSAGHPTNATGKGDIA